MKGRGKLLWLLLAVCLTGAAVSGGLLAHTLLEERAAARLYDDAAREWVEAPSPAAENGADREEPSAETNPWPSVDFAALAAVNPHVVAWIHCPGTSLSYPVVQGPDNDYYLNHLFDGSKNRTGCVFLDHRNTADFSDQNSILYGHYMKNGTMFTLLNEYKDPAFYQAHPVLWLLTAEQVYQVRLFAGYVAQTDEGAWETAFSDPAATADWLQRSAARSTFTADFQPQPGQPVLTLSTCTYELPNARYVLLGVLEGVG